MELLPHCLTAVLLPAGIRSLIGATRFLPVCSFQCSTPRGTTRRQPKSCFGENQLLRNSISFSLLTTSHPMVLNGQPVRASTHFYMRFTLLMVSSSRFGSYPCPYYFALFTLAFTVPPWDYHLDKDKGTLAGSFFNRHAVTLAGSDSL